MMEDAWYDRLQETEYIVLTSPPNKAVPGMDHLAGFLDVGMVVGLHTYTLTAMANNVTST